MEADEPCHLVEVVIRGGSGDVDFGDFTQPDGQRGRSEWQVAYDERVIAIDGDATRAAFFFHYLDFSQPLLTPFGAVEIPPESPVPPHLATIEYEDP